MNTHVLFTLFQWFMIGACGIATFKIWFHSSGGRKIQSGLVAAIAMLVVIAVMEAAGMR